MALLTNGGASMKIPNASNSNPNSNKPDEPSSDDFFLSNLINSLPCWDPPATSLAKPGLSNTPPGLQNSTLTDEFTPYNILGPIGGASHKMINHSMIPGHHHHHSMSTHHFPQIPEHSVMGGIGISSASQSHHNNGIHGLSSSFSPSTSPLTSSSGSSSSRCISTFNNNTNSCGRCDHQATNRCLDCNDLLCDDCLHFHVRNNFTHDHCVIPLNNVSPIGSAASIHIGSSPPSNNNNNLQYPNSNNNHAINLNDPQCEIHREILRYVCETCKKLVCQECTLWDHKDHNCVPVSMVADGGRDKIQSILESGKTGTRLIKTSIDRAVSYSQAVDRDAAEASNRIRKAMRHFIMAAEERERTLLDRVDKMRQQKLTSLSDQMAGLRAALAGLAQTSDLLGKTLDSISNISSMDLAQTITRGESQVEQFAAMYKNLQPKEEFINFITPNFELLQEIRMQGDIVLVGNRVNSTGIPAAAATSTMGAPLVTPMARRPIVRTLSTPVFQGSSQEASAWDPQNASGQISPVTSNGKPQIGQSIPGSNYHVVGKPALGPSTTFAFDGHEDGQVSRPWGLCVDREGNIIVADRRNNRVQVFFPDGSFKLKFGSKGAGNGQFDLPAGISTDSQNRIVVVDKDNHRVQIFSATGTFILKFGIYGKDCGQFQYPWDVAVNSRGEMLITDSRNHRIQLFNPDGHFISRFSFDGVNHNRTLKGLTTPRGVCFTPEGHIIVSDFENHRLLLIDGGLNKILSAKGYEGSGIQEFCRPSGICCDDDGRVIVADSKNQRVVIFSPQLEFLWMVEIRPSTNSLLPSTLDEKDRPSDVALLPDGRLVVMVETSPDARDTCNPQKTFIQIY